MEPKDKEGLKNKFWISESTEGEWKDGEPTEKRGKVLWLNFKSSKGTSAMLNLNNIASEKQGVIGTALSDFIKGYSVTRTQPLQKLDEEAVTVVLCKERYGSVAASPIDGLEQCKKLAKAICYTFGTSKIEVEKMKPCPNIECDHGKTLKTGTTEIIDCPICKGTGSVLK